ncbi:MAG TPA: TonB-dependent receptor [Candidatus Acidoferrales bacterium]
MNRVIRNFRILALLALCLGAEASVCAQSSGTSGSVGGTVVDPSGAVVVGATVEVQNPVSGFTRTATTDSSGNFIVHNVPFNPYHLTVIASGFDGYVQDVSVNSTVPILLKISLKITGTSTSVRVESSGEDLLETDSTAHTDVDRALFEKLPLESASSSLSSLVTLSTPGIAADSNGLFHGLGDHASNSFSIDDQPITDQQSKVFSNQLPVAAVQSMEVIEGAPPAEFGDKTSVIIVVTTRSGLGVTTPHGSVTSSYGSFGSVNAGFDLSYGGQKWGNFIGANGLNTGRFLDGPEYVVMHDKGNEENVFDRFDFKPSQSDTINFNFGYTRSWFQTPNSYDAENATGWSGLVVPATCPIGQIGSCGGLGPNGEVVGVQDQRSKIGTINIAPAWTRLINSNTVLTVGAFFRQDRYNYYPSDDPFADLSPDLQLQTVGQSRRLTNIGGRASLSYVRGINNIKAGIIVEDTLLTENDNIGIVDPTANAVCLFAATLAPDTNPLLTNPAACVGPLQPNVGQGINNGASIPAFNPLLACYDLTRTVPLPASDGCPNSTSSSFAYNGSAGIKEVALYLEDTITKNNWTFNVGLRGDIYDGITSQNQIEPRLGVAYNVKPSNTVLRVSYARTLETPFNENLVLASEGCLNPVISAIMSSTISPCVATTPLSPGWRNEFHAGLQQAFGKYFVLDGEYIWKYTHKAYDFSVLGDTPITFPIEWSRSKIPGYAIRGTVPNFHGLTAFVVMSHVAARFFEPQVSGIGAAPVGSEVFRIDHDEKFNETTHVQYQPWKRAPWLGFNWRYDSGLVAGPVPCVGGNCANGPNGGGPDNLVDTSIITPDQQFQAGLFCGPVRATPTTPISSSFGVNLCPGSMYGSTLISIPAPNTENDDHNPPRIAPRNLFDVALGHDNLFNGDRYKWSVRFTAINITNKYALYNFLSTFSGTHYVSPRALTAEIGFHF